MPRPHPVMAAHDLAVEGVAAGGPGRGGGLCRGGGWHRRWRRGRGGRWHRGWGLRRGLCRELRPGGGGGRKGDVAALPGQGGPGLLAADAAENLAGMVQDNPSFAELRRNYMQNRTGMTISGPIVNIFGHIPLAPCNGRRL